METFVSDLSTHKFPLKIEYQENRLENQFWN